jgi:hypothetical protein
MSENDFECFASTGVNTPVTMFPDSVLRIFDFPETDFRPHVDRALAMARHPHRVTEPRLFFSFILIVASRPHHVP